MFVDRRYKPAETWLDGRGTAFRPGVHHVVGGSTKVYGASLPRMREQDLGAVEHLEGTSPAWPFSYADLEPFYAEAEQVYRVHGTTGEDPTEPWRSTEYPVPRAPARAVRRRPGRPVAHSRCAPERQRDGCRPAPGRDLLALPDL